MGFLDYALMLSLQKDEMKTRIRIDPRLQQPTLTRDEAGYDVVLPVPSMSKEGVASFLGYNFLTNEAGKISVGRLFRACVSHLTAHTLVPANGVETRLLPSRRSTLETFAESLVSDVYVSTYILEKHPERFADVAFANALDFGRVKPLERVVNPATRIMIALAFRVNAGITKGSLNPEEQKVVDQLTLNLGALKAKIFAMLAGKEMILAEAFEEAENNLIQTVELYGPVLEAPSLQYTEQIGPCSIFSKWKKPLEPEFEEILRKSLATLGGTVPLEESIQSCWEKESDAEASQAFDTYFHQKAREERILAKLKGCVEKTRFKSIGFPEEDYTEYLRTRVFLSGGSRRLLDSLRVATDSLDEDPGKEWGQLDLSTIIQVIASQKPATDVFMRDEYLSRSYAWGILFDASESMRIRADFGKALIICVAEATKELLTDPASWTLFAFNDRFYIMKDSSETYSRRIRARIGGLKFSGLTYMPDAIQVAGNILAKRYDEQRFLVVISDGWPYGYPRIRNVLSESIQSVQKNGVIVIGMGVDTDRMKNFFKLNSAVHTQKDLIRNFTKVYLGASATALKT
jgi:hypothetical protein